MPCCATFFHRCFRLWFRWHPFGAKSSPETTLLYCQSKMLWQTSTKFWSLFKTWSFKNEFEIVICWITAILYNLRHAIHNLLENHYCDIQIENGGPFLTPVLISPACIKVLSTFALIAHCETFVTFLPKWCKLGTPLTSHGPDQTRVEWSLYALPVAFELPRDIPPRPNPYLW